MCGLLSRVYVSVLAHKLKFYNTITCWQAKSFPWYLLITVYPVATLRSSYQATGHKKSLGLARPLAPVKHRPTV